jgi:putative inorganic carbon (HCO3(-)) transporter
LISYWAIALIATLLSPVRVAALDGMLKLTIYMIAFVSMSRMMRLGWRSVLVGTYLETALVVCAYAVQQWYLGAPELATWTDITSETAGTTRVYSFLGNPNLLAGYLIPALPLGAIAAIHWRSWGMKVLGAVVAILGAFCITQTQSRGGLLGLAAESFALVLLLVYWWGKRLPTWTLPVTFGGTAGAIALGTILVPTLRKRVVSIFGTEDSSNAFRVNVWMSVLNMIKVKPILGIGPGNKAFNLVYPLYQRSGYSALGAYSVPLELTVETGIIGVICYGWLIFSIFRQAWIALNRLRSDRNMDGLWIIAAIATIVGMMTHGLFDTVWYRPQVQLLWWLAIAIISSFYIAPIKHNES